MRILVVSNLQPHSHHSVRAANVVTFELLRALAAQKGVSCGFLHVDSGGTSAGGGNESGGRRELRAAGVEVLDPVRLSAIRPKSGAWRRMVLAKIDEFYPQVRESEKVWRAINAFAPDVVFVPWSEWLTALCAELPVPIFAYYGNPDAKSARARYKFPPIRDSMTLLSRAFHRIDTRALERAHLRQMMKVPMVGNVAANDAEYYRRKGHPNAFYIRNVWIDRFPHGSWRALRDATERDGIIIGNVGRVEGTGNTLALDLLGRRLLPILRRRLAGSDYRVRILGAGNMRCDTATFFHGGEVDLAGFVPDIDVAMLEAAVFLVLNNATHFKVGQTRFLHAWSLGGCVVAHKDAALSMPEIRHNENALLGESMAEIADLIALAMNDRVLRRRLGEAGYETFRSRFTANEVALSITERIRVFLGESAPTDIDHSPTRVA